MIALRIPVLMAIVSLHVACGGGEADPTRGHASETEATLIQVYGDSLVESDKLVAIGHNGRPHMHEVDIDPDAASVKDAPASEKHACVPTNPRYLAEFERLCKQSARHCQQRAKLRYRSQACP